MKYSYKNLIFKMATEHFVLQVLLYSISFSLMVYPFAGTVNFYTALPCAACLLAIVKVVNVVINCICAILIVRGCKRGDGKSIKTYNDWVCM